MAIRINDFPVAGCSRAIDIGWSIANSNSGRLYDGDYSRVIAADGNQPRWCGCGHEPPAKSSTRTASAAIWDGEESYREVARAARPAEWRG